jgi:hypothetical protein
MNAVPGIEDGASTPHGGGSGGVGDDEEAEEQPLGEGGAAGESGEGVYPPARIVAYGTGVYLRGHSDPTLEEKKQFKSLSRDLNAQEISSRFGDGNEFFIVCDLENDDVCVGRLKEIVKGIEDLKVQHKYCFVLCFVFGITCPNSFVLFHFFLNQETMIGTIEIPTASGFLSKKIDLLSCDSNILIGYMTEYASLSFSHLNKFYPSQKDFSLSSLGDVSSGDLFLRLPRREETSGVDIAKNILRAMSGPIVENFEGGQVAVSFRDLNKDAVFRTDEEIAGSSVDPLVDMEIEEWLAFLFVVATSVNPNEYGLSKSCLSALREILELMEEPSAMWFFATVDEIFARDKVQDFVKTQVSLLAQTSLDSMNSANSGKNFSYFLYDTSSGSVDGEEVHVPSWRLFWLKESKPLQRTENGRTTSVSI